MPQSIRKPRTPKGTYSSVLWSVLFWEAVQFLGSADQQHSTAQQTQRNERMPPLLARWLSLAILVATTITSPLVVKSFQISRMHSISSRSQHHLQDIIADGPSLSCVECYAKSKLKVDEETQPVQPTKSAGANLKKVTRSKRHPNKSPVKKMSNIIGKVKKGSAMTKNVTISKDTKLSSERPKPITSKKGNSKKEQKIVHWRNETDPVLCLAENNSDQAHTIQRIHWVVRGNPLPLRRHRTARGFVYNPSAPAQASFRNITRQILDDSVPHQLRNSTNGATLPIFPEGQPLVMTILFRMKRPNLHFIGNKPGVARLREGAPPELAPTRTDVDNLAKFVLDSLNGILYEDDRQINSLQITKLLDNDGLCQGSTEICCRPLSESDVPSLIDHSLDPM